MKSRLLGCLFLLTALPALAAEPDVAPKSLQMTPPRYPVEAAKAGVSGKVILEVTVGVAGQAEKVEVAKSSGSLLLDQAAQDAVQHWRFEPALKDGKPVVASLKVPVDFFLSDINETYRERLAAQSQQEWLAPVALDQNGLIAQYIEDPKPLEFDTVAQALAYLEQNAEEQPLVGKGSSVRFFTMDKDGQVSKWQVQSATAPAVQILWRERLVSDGKHGFFATKMLCEEPPVACDEYKKVVAQLMQKPIALTAPEKPAAESVADDEVPAERLE